MKLWLNGALVEHDAPQIELGTFSPGDGLFELIAVRDGSPRRLAAHFLRLRLACQLLAIPLRVTEAELQAAIASTAAANDLARGAARVIVTRQPPTFTITVAAAPEQGPVKLIVAAGVLRNEQSPLSMVQRISGPDSVRASGEAAAAGVNDAILLNGQGRVAETTSANIFVLEGGGLITPPLSEGAMAGIMRAEVIRLTRAEEQPLTRERLSRAGEVFVTNALGIRSVIAIDGAPIGDGEPGLITQMLAVRL